jgi:Ca2+-binding EF-hand superfamily protein
MYKTELTEEIFRQLDVDNDGRINKEEYCEGYTQLIEFLRARIIDCEMNQL